MISFLSRNGYRRFRRLQAFKGKASRSTLSSRSTLADANISYTQSISFSSFAPYKCDDRRSNACPPRTMRFVAEALSLVPAFL
jgi:hypothetical protein